MYKLSSSAKNGQQRGTDLFSQKKERTYLYINWLLGAVASLSCAVTVTTEVSGRLISEMEVVNRGLSK